MLSFFMRCASRSDPHFLMNFFLTRGKCYVDLSKGEGDNKILARLALRWEDFSRGVLKPMHYWRACFPSITIGVN